MNELIGLGGRGIAPADSAQRLGRGAQAALLIYTAFLALYPRRFRARFAEEMVDVFADALADQAGRGPIRLLLRELGDLPVVLVLQYLYQGKRLTMNAIQYRTQKQVAWLRWIARGFSLVYFGLAAGSVLFAAASPSPVALVMTAISIAMFIAWRWEKVGGILTMIASPGTIIAALYMTTLFNQSDQLLAAVVGTALTVATMIVGWFFVSLALYSEANVGAAEPESTARKVLTVLGYAALMLVVVGLLAASLFAAPYSTITTDEPGVTPGVPRVHYSGPGE